MEKAPIIFADYIIILCDVNMETFDKKRQGFLCSFREALCGFPRGVISPCREGLPGGSPAFSA